MNTETKKILIIAGPNGAGKTTFAREFLQNDAGCSVFINADVIAAGLSEFQPAVAAIKAGRLMLGEIRDHVKMGNDFAFETTLAGHGYLNLIREWRRNHAYHVKLFFLALQTPEEAISRVQARVAQGGHHVPDEVVRRRFHAGLKQFGEIYKHEVSLWRWYDNSGDVPLLIEEGENE